MDYNPIKGKVEILFVTSVHATETADRDGLIPNSPLGSNADLTTMVHTLNKVN